MQTNSSPSGTTPTQVTKPHFSHLKTINDLSLLSLYLAEAKVRHADGRREASRGDSQQEGHHPHVTRLTLGEDHNVRQGISRDGVGLWVCYINPYVCLSPIASTPQDHDVRQGIPRGGVR